MAKTNPQLEAYLQSQQDNLHFILHLTSLIDQLPSIAYKTPKLTKLTILPKQKITLEQAWQIITQFLENHNIPYYLHNRISEKPDPKSVFLIHLFLEQANLNYQQSPELLHQLLESANQLAPTEETSAHQKALDAWRQQITNYNQRLTNLHPHFTPDQLLESGSELFDPNQFSQSLTPLLPQAVQLARQLDPQGKLTPDSLHLALKRLSPRRDPNLRTFITLLHQQDNRQKFFSVVKAHLPQLTQLSNQKTDFALNPPPNLPPTELERQIYLALTHRTNLSFQEAAQIAAEIVATTNISALNPNKLPNSTTIIEQTLRRHHLNPDPQLLSVLQPLTPYLELYQHRQAQAHFLARQHHATSKLSDWIFKTIARETKLDPRILLNDQTEDIRAYLQDNKSSEEELLLKLQDRLSQATNPQEINRLLGYTDFLQQKLHLNSLNDLESKAIKLSTKLLLKSYQNNAKIIASLNRYALAYQRGLDIYFKLEDILSGRFIFAKIYDTIEDLKKTKWGWLIAPFEKFSLWWNEVLTNAVNKGILSLENKTSFLAKFARKALQLFKLGEYSIDGFIVESSRALLAWTYQQSLKLVKKATSPFTSATAKAISWVSDRLIIITSSSAFETLSTALGTTVAFGLQGFFLTWYLLGDIYQFFHDIFQAIVAPSLSATLSSLWNAFRRLSTKTTLGLIGAIVGATLASWTGIGAILAAITGFLLGHGLGDLLNSFYEKFLKPFSLLISSFTLIIVTGLGAIIISNLILIFLPLLAVIVGFTFIYSSLTSSARLPEGVGGIQSQYIRVTKHATATWKDKDSPGSIDNSQLPQTVTYSITIQARNNDLKNVTITDEAILYQKNDRETKIYTKTTSLEELKLGDSHTYTYNIPLTQDYKDSFLSNSVTVTAVVNGEAQTAGSGVGIAIGTPPLLPLAKFAVLLANTISQYCVGGGQVTTASLASCQDQIRSLPNGNRVYSTLYASADSYDTLQCVGFVKAVIAGAGKGTPFISQHLHYAGELTTTPMAGFDKVSSPMPVDIVIFPGEPGHIAVIVGVAGNTIRIADANVVGPGLTRSNSNPYAIQPGFVFYRPKP